MMIHLLIEYSFPPSRIVQIGIAPDGIATLAGNVTTISLTAVTTAPKMTLKLKGDMAAELEACACWLG